jgi:hypothetical protein
MKLTNATLTKTSTCWLIVLEWDDGERNDYRFPTQTAARAWACRAGVTLAN